MTMEHRREPPSHREPAENRKAIHAHPRHAIITWIAPSVWDARFDTVRGK